MASSLFLFLALILGRTTLNARSSKINVHLVPHTHNDVGWLKTVDEYFLGSHNEIQGGGVRYILNSVIDELLKNPKRKFVYVEIAYFRRWWRELEDTRKDQVRRLISSGQLEFANGGYVMSDEACPSYGDMIDQQTLGAHFLAQEFGREVSPLAGWQVDPFGHSSFMSVLYAQMGVQGWFMGREDAQEAAVRKALRTLETAHEGSSSLPPEEARVYTHYNVHSYGAPPGFDFDLYSHDPPINDNEELEDYNVQERLQAFVHEISLLAAAYIDPSRVSGEADLLLTMGNDFNYMQAATWFVNMDKLIYHANNLTNLNVFYSTPSLFLKARNRNQMYWPLKTDDWFPYNDGRVEADAKDPTGIPPSGEAHAYWTGYFTSRPQLKRLVRKGAAILKACKLAQVVVSLSPGSPSSLLSSFSESVWNLAEGMAIAQHHDAVSGTEKQKVADDYSRRIHKGIRGCTRAMGEMGSGKDMPPIAQPEEAMIKDPPLTHPMFLVSNPLSWPVEVPLHHLCPSPSLSEVPSPSALPPTRLEKWSLSRYSCPLEASPSTGLRSQSGYDNTAADSVVLGGEEIKLQWGWYEGSLGDTEERPGQTSGAYIFRPNCTENVETPCPPHPLSVKEGWVKHKILKISDVEAIVEWEVGPIPVQDGKGKEIVLQFFSGFKNLKKVFFTDSNGRGEWNERRVNFRKMWNLNVTDPVSMNYYPIVAGLRVFDDEGSKMLTLIPDRTVGGSAFLQEGKLELMLHRRLLKDDQRGVDEPLNETDSKGEGLRAKGRIRVLRGEGERGEDFLGAARKMVESVYPIESFPVEGTAEELKGFESAFSAPPFELEIPPQLSLLSLELLERKGAAMETTDGKGGLIWRDVPFRYLPLNVPVPPAAYRASPFKRDTRS